MAIIDVTVTNKEIPHIIQEQIFSALSHYPELADTHIRFKFTRSLGGSIMAARPVVASLFGDRKNRQYEILISAVFKLSDSIEPIHQVEDDVLIGWIGHELGHIMDYEQRSTIGIARFGLLYWLSKRYIRKAERVADTFAVQRGIAPYLLATKNFILTHSGLSEKYKNKIASLYLSPDDIVALVEELKHSDKEEKRQVIAEEEVIGDEIK